MNPSDRPATPPEGPDHENDPLDDAEATRVVTIAPTLAAAGYEPTMVLRGPRNTTDVPTAPDSLVRGGSAPTLPGASLQSTGTMQQVGRYLIRERLGRGGMATVFKAHDPTINREVAIKFLHASLCADDEYRARFLREARAAGGLSHPNIVVVHDVGEIDGRPYMAMELIDGVSLAEDLEKQKQMPIRDVVVMGMQLARALDYAHGRGIVHRDIKPGNIMRLTGSQTIKVADFGIAHMDDRGEDTDAAQHTRIGDVLGTPQYMSPEQANGEKLDGRSDLFSTGIVLYQMLTGRRPFRGDSLVAVATRITTEDPPPINKQRPDVPASLRRVIDRCLAKQPSSRFQTGRELSDALAKVLAELDEIAREKNRPRIVPLRVKWAAMMAAIVAVVMGLTAAVITQRQYAAMMAQVSDYGASLARMIAQQHAAAVLGEDWVQVDVGVQEIMKTRNFERVTVIDLGGIVRVSSLPALVGQPYQPEVAERLGNSSDAIATTRYAGAGGSPVLGFEAPITFQDKQVGRVALGVPEEPLTQVARLSIMLMVVLAVVTVLAVAIAMYFVANWFAKPIRLVADSMVEIGKGRFDHRINEQRKDEFGELYVAFDAMAQALQDRAAAGIDTPLPPTVATPRTVATTARGASAETARGAGGETGPAR
jgi:HAMP domain-containing protein/predicted Ser/Thr protein kinase